MGYLALKWAFEVTVDKSSDKAVLLCIAKHANNEGACFPGLRTIARLACCSETTVARAMRSLEKQKLILRRARYRADGTKTTDLIILQLPPDLDTSGRVGSTSPVKLMDLTRQNDGAEDKTLNVDSEGGDGNVIRLPQSYRRPHSSNPRGHSNSVIDTLDRLITQGEVNDDPTTV